MAADFLYWRLGGAGPLDGDVGPPISESHGILNAVLYFGGILLFFVLLILSWLLWRVNERARS